MNRKPLRNWLPNATKVSSQISALDTSDALDPTAFESLDARGQERLVQILDQYLVDLEEGRSVDATQLIAEHPQFAGPLRHYLGGLQLLRSLDEQNQEQPLSAGTMAAFGKVLPDLNGLPFGSVLGPYELRKVIGRGAMGVVYQAHDRVENRDVAVKILAGGGAFDASRIDRFRREAKAAASLHHPNVVSVYAVGCYDGTHYYAMQLIEGASLDQRINAAAGLNLNVDDLLICGQVEAAQRLAAPLLGEDRYVRIAQLGASAASALQATHKAGIIHRDVKPSNLLLDNVGQLWITDFGLARTTAATALTRTGDLIGTLRYMSPEQARGQGDLIDARSDIYSLGATLYELVTLVPAFAGDDLTEVLRKIQSNEPTSPRVLDRKLPVDLETIILRAMRPRSADRYPSAAAMAEDLQRFVEGKPIRAHGVSFSERMWSWARNHKRLAMAGIFVLLASLLGSMTLTIVIGQLQSKTAAALALSDQHYREARHVVDTFGLDVARKLAGIPNTAALQSEVLENTVAYYERFVASAVGDPSLQLDVAETHLKIARLATMAGEFAKGHSAYKAAVDSFEKFASENADRLGNHEVTADASLQQVRAWNEWALLANKLGQTDNAFERLNSAERKLQSRLKSLDSSRGESMKELELSDAPESYRSAALVLLAMTHNNCGVVYLGQQQLTKAMLELRKAVEILSPFENELQIGSEALSEAADAFSNFSVLLSQTDHFSEAAQAAEQSLRLRRLLPASGGSEQLVAMGVTYSNLATLHWKADDTRQAIAAYRQAIDLFDQAINFTGQHSDAPERLAVTLNNLGLALHVDGDLPAAEQSFSRAQAILRPILQAQPDNREVALRLAGVQNNLAVLLKSQGRNVEAEPIMHSAFGLIDRYPEEVKQGKRLQLEENWQSYKDSIR